jgi:hypothetical protein
VPGRVQETTEKYQHQELPEKEPGRVVKQRNQRHRYCARKIRDDARPLETRAVHDRPAEEASHHGREQECRSD